MCKAVLMIFLAVMSSSVMAEWIRFGDDAYQTAYYDPATIHKDNNKVEVFTLHDMNSAMPGIGGKYLSLLEFLEYDCTNKLVMVNSMSMLSKNMGKGKTIWTDANSGKWEAADISSTVEYPPFKVVCKKQ